MSDYRVTVKGDGVELRGSVAPDRLAAFTAAMEPYGEVTAVVARERLSYAHAHRPAKYGGKYISVVEHVRRAARGCSAAQVAAALGIEPGTAKIYLARAVRRGHLQRNDRGRYGRMPDAG